ncbi:hypothetical protein BC831DRAFT_446781 [Entophlyctis helioformis]|nr:hypothetical protein BC831DRAFT_446781 [Entophlyctis helioformis]
MSASVGRVASYGCHAGGGAWGSGGRDRWPTVVSSSYLYWYMPNEAWSYEAAGSVGTATDVCESLLVLSCNGSCCCCSSGCCCCCCCASACCGADDDGVSSTVLDLNSDGKNGMTCSERRVCVSMCVCVCMTVYARVACSRLGCLLSGRWCGSLEAQAGS